MEINKEELRKFVEENPKLVTRRQSKRHPNLYVLKYAKRVFYDNLWNQHPLLVECRGLIVDENYNVVVKPFTKIFNYQENGTTIDMDENCLVVRKVNGFMGVATWDPSISDKLIYSTTGSLDSDFVDLIAKHVDPFEEEIKRKCGKFKTTLIFEICDETDPHIIEEKLGAWLIGAFMYVDYFPKAATEQMLDNMAKQIGCLRPEQFYAKFSDVIAMSKTCKHEGFMVYGQKSGTGLKLKSPYYLTTKFIARASETKLLNTIFSGERNRAREKVDEEFFPLIDYLLTIDGFKEMEEQSRIAVIREFLDENYAR